MQRVKQTGLLAIGVAGALLLAIGVRSARAEPETARVSSVAAAIGPRLLVGEGPAASPIRERVNARMDAAHAAEPVASARLPAFDEDTRPAPIPLGGPNAPTPFGLSLVGLFGVGVAMHRRRRQMSAPLL